MLTKYQLELQAKKLGQAKPEEKKIYRIPLKSAKRKIQDRKYIKKVKAQVEKDNRCKIKSPVCTGFMQGFDHIQKRSPLNVLEDKNLLPACNACNQYKEQHPKWARDNGFDISKFKK